MFGYLDSFKLYYITTNEVFVRQDGKSEVAGSKITDHKYLRYLLASCKPHTIFDEV